MLERQTRRTRRFDLVGQRRLDRRLPAAQHLFEPRVERRGVGDARLAAQIERVANERDDAVLHRDRPAEQIGVRRLRQHLADRNAPRGGQVVARQPDEREQMPTERRLHDHQFRARPIGEAHRGERELLQLVGLKRSDQIMRQRGQRVGQRLAGMALGIEPEFRLQLRQARAQHRDRLRRGAQRRAGPQPGMDRQPLDRAPGAAHRDEHEVERHLTVNGRDQVGFEQQRRIAALVEPVQRAVARARGEDRRGMIVARNPQPVRHGAVAQPAFMAEQREVSREEPVEQGRALEPLIRAAELDGIRLHRAFQRAPVADRGADIGQVALDRLDQLAALLGVDPVHFDVDHRFGGVAPTQRLDRAIGIARNADHRVDDAFDRDAMRPDRRGNRIDQERHVVIDDRQPHPPPPLVGARQRLERDACLTGRALAGKAGDEARGLGAFGGAEALQFTGKRTIDEPVCELIGQGFERFGRHGTALCACAESFSRGRCDTPESDVGAR